MKGSEVRSVGPWERLAEPISETTCLEEIYNKKFRIREG